jgi:hypothetical protein
VCYEDDWVLTALVSKVFRSRWILAHRVILAEARIAGDTVEQQLPVVIDLANIGLAIWAVHIITKCMDADVREAFLLGQPLPRPECSNIIAKAPRPARPARKAVHENELDQRFSWFELESQSYRATYLVRRLEGSSAL